MSHTWVVGTSQSLISYLSWLSSVYPFQPNLFYVHIFGTVGCFWSLLTLNDTFTLGRSSLDPGRVTDSSQKPVSVVFVTQIKVLTTAVDINTVCVRLTARHPFVRHVLECGVHLRNSYNNFPVPFF
jgi:hypothetical protein